MRSAIAAGAGVMLLLTACGLGDSGFEEYGDDDGRSAIAATTTTTTTTINPLPTKPRDHRPHGLQAERGSEESLQRSHQGRR